MKKLVALFLSLCLLLSVGMTALAETPVTPFSEVDTENFTIDYSDPLNSLVHGMFSHELAMADGSTRTMYQYIPTTWRYGQPEVAVAVPSGKDPIAFFEETGWKAIAEAAPCAIILMTADNWADQDEYVNACWKYMNDRTYLYALKIAFYMVGYGDAANQVMEFAVLNNDALAGVAAFGVDNFDVSLLEAGKVTETAEAGVMKADVPVPMWIGVEEKTAAAEDVIAYWMDVNEVADLKFSNDYADEIYFYPGYLSKTFEKTYQSIQSLYVTVGLDDVAAPAFTENLYFNWLSRVRRAYRGNVRPLTYYATADELGFDHIQFQHEGETREYWVYVPTSIKASGEEAPLVIVAHGVRDSAEEFITYTDWYKCAEERGFIVAHIMGSRSTTFNATSRWDLDDVETVKAIRSQIIENYPIDLSRVYMTGHSNGCGLTHNVIRKHPELFAAAVGHAGLSLASSVEYEINESLIIPFMSNGGDLDGGYSGNQEKIAQYIAEWCERYGLDMDTPYKYENGLLYGVEYHNSQGIPLYKYQLNKGKVHCMESEDPYTIYDFLCNFSRGEDGTSYYMGVEIKLDK